MHPWHNAMMPSTGIVVLLLVALQGSPEDALKKFVVAFDGRDPNGIAALVVGGQSRGSYLDMWKAQKVRDKETLSVKVEKSKVSGSKATVAVVSTLKSGSFVSTEKESLQLAQQKDKSWKIVPSKTKPKKGPIGILAHYSVAMLPVERNNMHLSAADQIRLRRNHMESLSYYLSYHMWNTKGTYPTTTYALRGFLEGSHKLLDPIDNRRYVISLNPALAGKKLSTPGLKRDTVVLFLGKPGNVWFDQHGYTYLGLADGSAIKATRAEASKLRWKL